MAGSNGFNASAFKKCISERLTFPKIITLSGAEQVIIKHAPLFTQGTHVQWTKYMRDGDIMRPILVDPPEETPITETDAEKKRYNLYSEMILFLLASSWTEKERAHDIESENFGVRIFECNMTPVIEFRESKILFTFIDLQ